MLHKLLGNDGLNYVRKPRTFSSVYARRGRNSAHLIYGVFLGVSETFVGSLLCCGDGVAGQFVPVNRGLSNRGELTVKRCGYCSVLW